MNSLIRTTFVFSSLALCSCLDPLVDDEIAALGMVLPAGTMVPSAHDDPIVEQQITENDGVPTLIPRIKAFAQGAPVHYWDFGPSPEFAAPIFLVAKRNEQGDFERLPHPTIVDTIPGDPGYSPYWAVLFLEVTDAYDGELITSFAAVEEAQALGLIKAPTPAPFAVNCPTVAADTLLEVGGGQPPMPPESLFFWNGTTVRYYDLGIMAITGGTNAAESSMYVISREGQEPLSEPLRGVDITGDGDTLDTNNVFTVSKTEDDYTPLCRRVNVTVPSEGLSLIDTTQSDTQSSIQHASLLFNPGPVPATVIAFEDTEFLGNCPQQSQEGGL